MSTYNVNVSPYPITETLSPGQSITVPVTIPVPPGSNVSSGSWMLYLYLSPESPYFTFSIVSPDNLSLWNGKAAMTSAEISQVNAQGTFGVRLALGSSSGVSVTATVDLSVSLTGTFPPPPPTGPTTPPWPGPPEWPGYPGWPGVPTIPASGLPYPGWPGGPDWPGYPPWGGTFGGSGWQGWGSIITRVPQGDFIQSNRYRGSRESDKINSIAKSSGTDAQTGLIKTEWLQYLCYNNNEAYYIAADYALRHLQHLRQQLEWRIGIWNG